ncbi:MULTISPECIES: hypothetical protein [Paraburkholderia]|uniref:hypothetical protein n=1 Tax=Paraburkholderia TaxID=1822464 RepID=UPI001EF783AF|nr:MULTISPECIES: hypothetical protein [Paraburkholderia]
MRRIDAEYDLPQFLASALVRKIAANQFRLPPTERVKFQRLSDEVIARIEEIVRDAYLEAGEDVGGDTVRAHLWQQALTARRDMVANGELISEADFRQRLGLPRPRLSKLLADGSVFALEVEGAEYFPVLLADPALNQQRLQEICRVIVPAPSWSRLDFLSSKRGSLGDRSPVEMLDADHDFKRARKAATAWASKWSRTVVKMYQGEHEFEPIGINPLYTAAAEIDPRRPIWTRASEALHIHGYEWPPGPYPDVRKFTLFVERQTVGHATPTPEACVQILVDGECIRVRIIAAAGTHLDSEAVLSGNAKSFVEVAERVIAHSVAKSGGR